MLIPTYWFIPPHNFPFSSFTWLLSDNVFFFFLNHFWRFISQLMQLITLVSVDVYIQPCKQAPDQVREHLHESRPLPAKTTTVLRPTTVDWPGLLLNTLLKQRVWSLLGRTSFIQHHVCEIHFYVVFSLSIVWKFYHLITHSSPDGHLGCFQLGAVTEKAARNFPTPVSWWTPSSQLGRHLEGPLGQAYVHTSLQ